MEVYELLRSLALCLFEYVRGFFFEFLDINKFMQFIACMLTSGILGSMLSSNSSFSKEGRFLTSMVVGVIWFTLVYSFLSRSIHEQYWGLLTVLTVHWSFNISIVTYLYTKYTD